MKEIGEMKRRDLNRSREVAKGSFGLGELRMR
jgi:hypothetical protein